MKRLLLLMFLSATIPELLTGSTPFWNLLNPFTLAGLLIVYGIPAVLIREFVMSRGEGYRSVLLLGLLEGVLIEGMAVNTFYSDKLDTFSSYGRFLGVNWPWLFYLTIFHAVFSVLLPIMIFDSIYEGRFLSKVRQSYLIPVALMVLLFNLSEEVYKPSLAHRIFSLLLMGLLVLIYLKLRGKRLPGPSFPLTLAYLYPPALIIFAFFALAERVHPLVHVLVSVPFFTTLYNSLEDVDPWLVGRRLLLGMVLVSFFVAVADDKMYMAPPALAYLALTLYLDKRLANQGTKEGL